jgi:hypothetical protein
MDGIPALGGLPRQPFLERITPRQWVLVDVAIAGISFAVGTVALFVVPDVTHPLSVSRWGALATHSCRHDSHRLPTSMARGFALVRLRSPHGEHDAR